MILQSRSNSFWLNSFPLFGKKGGRGEFINQLPNDRKHLNPAVATVRNEGFSFFIDGHLRRKFKKILTIPHLN